MITYDVLKMPATWYLDFPMVIIAVARRETQETLSLPRYTWRKMHVILKWVKVRVYMCL